MFHLLVSYQGWPEGVGTMPSGRVYLRPGEHPCGDFFVDGKLDIGKIGQIPALLVTETGGAGPQVARVAYITGVTESGRETVLHYATDSSVPTMSNEDLEKLAPQLGIGKSALTHTHWEFKDADLFKVLLMNQGRVAPAPKVFSLEAFTRQDPHLSSVMMPFSAEFYPVYKAIQVAADTSGLTCKRADDIWEHHAIIQDVVNLIARARVVVCDCSGRNANVFYEAGIAHAIGKEVVLITQSEADIPFDLRHLRYVRYLNNRQGLATLADTLQSRFKTILESA